MAILSASFRATILPFGLVILFADLLIAQRNSPPTPTAWARWRFLCRLRPTLRAVHLDFPGPHYSREANSKLEEAAPVAN